MQVFDTYEKTSNIPRLDDLAMFTTKTIQDEVFATRA